MKKLFTLGLAIAMILAMAITFIGCGATDIIGDIGDGDDGEVLTENMDSKKDIKNALGDNYEITLKYGFTSSEDDDGAFYITTKNVGQDYYTETVSNDGDKDYYLVIGNKAYTNYDEDDGKFWRCVKLGDYNPCPKVYDQLMSGYQKNLSYTTKKSGKFLDRDVTTYIWKETTTAIVGSVTVEHEYVVDKITGLTLKQVISYSGTTIQGSGSASTSYEVTKMKVGGVTLSAEKNKIAIDEWISEADFTKFGVSSVAKVQGEFSYSRGFESEKEYVYEISDATTFDTLSQSFYNVGFKKNYDCEIQPITELKDENEYSHVKKFNGYIGEGSWGDYGVEIELIPPFNEGGNYKLTITVYDNTLD